MTEKIKIAFIIPTLTLGGAEKQQILIFNSIDRNIFEPRLFVFKNKVELLPQIKYVNEVKVYDSKGILSLVFSGIIKDLKDFKPDIIHSQMYNANLFSRFVYCFIPKVKILNHVHGLGRWMGFFTLSIEKATSFLSDRFILVSEKSRELRLKREKYPKNKTVVFLNSVETEKFKEIRPLKGNIINLGVASRLIKLKRIDKIINFISWCLKNDQKIMLHIAGNGVEEENLKKLVEEKGIEKDVIFYGMIQDMTEFYSKIDVLSIASETEDLPLTVIEALAAGKTVISTPVGNISKTLEGTCSLLTSFDKTEFEKIKEFISKLDRSESDNINRNVAEKFSHDNYMKKLEKLYLDLLNK